MTTTYQLPIARNTGLGMLDRMESSDSHVPPQKHEKLYLSPENAVKGQLRKTFGNPTPVALAGFLLANTPASIMLMGWHNAGSGTGNIAAGNASYMFFGGVLLLAGGIGEWVLGNSFPSVVFFTLGAYWLTLGGTLMPFYFAITSYTDGSGLQDPKGFYDSFTFFLLWMGVLTLLYTICALRTNILLVVTFFLFTLAFPCLSASYFYASAGRTTASANCRIAGGALTFIASLVVWYIFTSLLFEAVDFPVSLPVGDLSTIFLGKQARRRASEAPTEGQA